MKRTNPDRRTERPCDHCGTAFLRTRNTRHCSHLCRFLDKVRSQGECWIWTAAIDSAGYGWFYADGRNKAAHRYSYELHVGPIPDGLVIDHLCRVRACVNPAHMEPVTLRENTLRGEAPTAVAWREGRCKNNHPRTPENTYVRNERSRQCRICMQSSRAKREGRAA